VDESPLGLHEVELVVDPGEHFSDCGGVGDHADCAHDLGEVAAWHHGGGLLVDAALEAGRAPVYELDGPLGLDRGYGCIYVLRDYVSPLHEAAGHLLAVARVTLGHHGSWFKCAVRDLSD